MHRLIRPLTARATYRRWAHLVLGGALLMPYVLLVSTGFTVREGQPMVYPPFAPIGMSLAIVGLCVPLLVVTGFVPAVRKLEGIAARELVGGPIAALPVGEARSWPDRWRAGCWLATHCVIGGVVSALTLAVPPGAVILLLAAPLGDFAGLGVDGWGRAWGPVAGIALLAGLAWLAAGAGALLARLAPVLLGPSNQERLDELQRRADELAERNRLARELHDSVGHALSVVTVQAGAAGLTLDTDPAFARKALDAIEEAARGALDDLDHVLGLLRDDAAPTQPRPGLAELDGLIARSGLEVGAEVTGTIERVPRAVSEEAYRIVQECLTNAARHAGRVPVTLRLAAGSDQLTIEAANPLGTGSGGAGGRGLRGIAERVAVLRGRVTAGPEDGRWVVRVALPLRAGR